MSETDRLLEALMHLSLLAIFAAGLLTFASPCVLPLVPVYLSVLGGAAGRQRHRPVIAAMAFALGLSSVFVVLGAAVGASGAALLAHRTALAAASGALMLLFGLRALGVLRVPLFDRDARPGLARLGDVAGLGSAFLFGASFALGWSPCIGPMLASVLGWVATHASSPWRGAGLLAVYSAGLSTPLVVLAAFAPAVLGGLGRFRGAIPRLERIAGALLLVVGAWTLWSARPAPAAGDPGTAVALTPGRVSAAAPGEAAPCAEGAKGHVCALPDARTTATSSGAEDPAGESMLEFVAPHCPVCQRMEPVIAVAERECDGLGTRIVRVDVTTASGRAFAARRGVVGTPTFVFTDSAGQEWARLVGEQPGADVEAAVEHAFGLRCAASPGRPSSSG